MVSLQHPLHGCLESNAEDGDDNRDVELNNDLDNNANEAEDRNVEADEEASADVEDRDDESTNNLAVILMST